MPRGDGSGPNGFGPMTGRAAGFCAGYGVPGYANPIAGRGLGSGWGRGRGAGRGFGLGFGLGRGFGRGFGFFGVPAAYPAAGFYPESPVLDPEREKTALTAQAEYLENELAAIRKRLEGKSEAQDK